MLGAVSVSVRYWHAMSAERTRCSSPDTNEGKVANGLFLPPTHPATCQLLHRSNFPHFLSLDALARTNNGHSRSLHKGQRLVRRSDRKRRAPGPWWKERRNSSGSSNFPRFPSTLLEIGSTPTAPSATPTPSVLTENTEALEKHDESAHLTGEKAPSVAQPRCSAAISTPRSDISAVHSAAQSICLPNVSSELIATQDNAQEIHEGTGRSRDNAASLHITNVDTTTPNSPNPVLDSSPSNYVEESELVTPQQNRRPFRSLDNIIHELNLSPPGAPRRPRASQMRSQEKNELNPVSFDLKGADSSSPSEDSDGDPERSDSGCPDSPPLINLVPNFGNERASPSFMLGRRENLSFSSVPAVCGVIKIAVGLSIDSSFAGEFRISPHSSTGRRSTYQNNEFYFIVRGCLEWDIGATRVRAFAGDFVGVPHTTLFSIRNPSFHEAVAIYFSPTSQFT